jgi:hypothetical protein
MTQQKKEEIKHDELADADLDKVSGGVLCTNVIVMSVPPHSAVSNAMEKTANTTNDIISNLKP